MYLRPCHLLHGPDAVRALAAGEALPLAGGPSAFARVEVLHRNRHGAAEGELFPVAALPHAGLIPKTVWHDWLHRATMVRRPLAGLDLGTPRLMGIVNVTPDSFSEGGRHDGIAAALAHARALIAGGADILDLGGESTRPGAAPVAPEIEHARVLPLLRALAGETAVPLSVDTRNAALMRAAASAGAALINDVSALRHDPGALSAMEQIGLPVVLMHMQGDPETMQRDPRYDDVLLDVYDHLAERIAVCERAGIPRDRVVVDPGIGFGKSLAHNLRLLANLALFHGLGCPLLLGTSRKGFIGHLSDGAPPDRRLGGSVATVLAGLLQGVQIFRVHDVAETRQALTVWRAIQA